MPLEVTSLPLGQAAVNFGGLAASAGAVKVMVRTPAASQCVSCHVSLHGLRVMDPRDPVRPYSRRTRLKLPSSLNLHLNWVASGPFTGNWP